MLLERRKRRNPLERVILLFLLIFFIFILFGLLVLVYVVFFSNIQPSNPSSQYIPYYYRNQLDTYLQLLFLKIPKRFVPVYRRFPRNSVSAGFMFRYGVSFDGSHYYSLNFMPDMYSQTVLCKVSCKN